MALLAVMMLLFSASAEAKTCSGAAAMVERGCSPHSKTVFPYPSDDLDVKWGVGVERNKRFCRGGIKKVEGMDVCFLGAAKPRKTLALIGDSHSAHWRPAMDKAARRLGIGIISLVGSGCDFSVTGRAPILGFDMTECDRFRKRVPGFLAVRTDIETVIMAQASYQGPGEKQAYLEAWRALPESVKHVVSIVDNPRGDKKLYSCLRRAVREGRRPGLACASPRRQALKPDYAAEAVKELQGRKGQVFDFSDFFCDQKRCFSVIGGRLVYAQGSHQAPGFNLTLAPYLQRKLATLL